MASQQTSVNKVEFRNSVATLVEHVEDPDQAYKFLKEAGISQDEALSVDIRRLRRKIDWHIVPIMMMSYLIQFVDKVAINYAAVMGLNRDLHLQGNDFSNVATALFAAYLIAEVPNGIILNKVPVAKWLGFNAIAWGIATACTAAAYNYHTLLAARIFLGIFEAATTPCVALIISQWYTRSEQASRMNFWGCGLAAGQIIGGLLSYGFQHVQHASLAGWRIMFIVLGAATILLGTAIVLFIPDTPMSARFLNDMEKTAILRHTATNQTGIRNPKFKLSHLRELVGDIQIWMLALLAILSTEVSGVVTSYSSTLIRNFGFTPANAALLNTPSGLVSIAALLISGYGIRHFSNRWAFIAMLCLTTVLGASLMSFLPNSNRAGLLAGIYLVNCPVAVLFIVFQWGAANVAGYTKRVVTQTLLSASFGVANLIGPQTFRASEAPTYRSAKIAVLATQGGAALTAFLLFLYYRWENKRRDARSQTSVEGMTIGQWENLTDKENPSFRYVY